MGFTSSIKVSMCSGALRDAGSDRRGLSIQRLLKTISAESRNSESYLLAYRRTWMPKLRYSSLNTLGEIDNGTKGS